MGPGMDVNAAISSGYGVPNDRWVFVGERDFVRPDVDHYYIERSRNVTIINNSAVINYTYVDNSRHVTYVSGPRGDDVQRVTGAPVKRVVIQEYDRPGQNLSNDQLHIYRPRVQSNTGSGRNPVPPRVRDLDEVRRSPGGNSRPPGQQYGSPSNPGRELAPPRGKEERTPPALDQDRGTKPPAQGGSGYPPKPPTDPSRVRQPQVERNNGMLRQPPNAAPVNPNRGKGKVPRTPRTDQERLKRKKPAPQQAVPPVPPNGRKEREGRDSVKKE
jgi:hypothetical protein